MFTRVRSTDVRGNKFSQLIIDLVWKSANPLGMTSLKYDKCGKLMRYEDYGNTNSSLGWEIDHIKPASKGGSDDLANLQALQWENNRKKSDTYPWNCS